MLYRIDVERALFAQTLRACIDAHVGAFPCDVAGVVRYVHRHLVDPGLSVRGAMSASGVHSNSFQSRFTHFMGLPPRAYIEDQRMMLAMYLLGVPKASVLEIGLSVGFAQPNSFTRAFKRYVGCTPSTFRDKRIGLLDGTPRWDAPVGRNGERPHHGFGT